MLAQPHAAVGGRGAAAARARHGSDRVAGQEGFRFKSGVELINVTVTVTDRSGRFAAGLRQEDFVVYEDDKPVEVTHFSAERTPVSLGIVLDTSGSMAGEKIESARDAIDRFLQALPDPQDEFFMYRFSADPDLVNDWTNDREAISRNLARVHPPAAPRCTTRSPKRCRWRRAGRTARRRSSSSRTATTPTAG